MWSCISIDLCRKHCDGIYKCNDDAVGNAQMKNWDMDLIHKLGYPESIFQQIQMPGTDLGKLKGDIVEEIGYNCRVVLPATHDTGSAVVALPFAEDFQM